MPRRAAILLGALAAAGALTCAVAINAAPSARHVVVANDAGPESLGDNL